MALKIRVHERLNEAFSLKTVKIGNQVWMAENLSIDDGGVGIYYNEDNGEYYYTWEAAMRVAKSIPGWHLPTALEWNEAALACGATILPFKDGSNPNLNEYDDVQELKDKLGVKLVGYVAPWGLLSVGSNAYFWTATERSSTSAYNHTFYADATMGSDYNYKNRYAYSVRLIRD